MKRSDLECLSIEELWNIREQAIAVLADRLSEQERMLDHRLSQLAHPDQRGRPDRRRHRSNLSPKFRNPDQPSQTWAGRGKKPRWLVAQLSLGKQVEEFLIIEHAVKRTA